MKIGVQIFEGASQNETFQSVKEIALELVQRTDDDNEG